VRRRLFLKADAAALLSTFSMACGAPAAAWAQSCSSSAATPQPAWVQTGAPEDATHLFANGVADWRSGAALDATREAARTRALAELGQQIQADVKSRITETLERVTATGRSTSNENFVSVSEVQSRLSLRNVQLAEQWVDTTGCRLWVRVRVPKADAERARAAATSDGAAASLKERLALANDAARPLAERLGALAESRELARLADPALTPGYSRDSFALQEAELAGTLGAQRDRETQYREAVLRHVQALSQANAAPAGPARRAGLNRALAALESAQTLVPGGVAGFKLPFAPDERLATLYADLGAPCVGRQWFERRGAAVPAALLSARPQGCDAAQVAKERRALYLDGKTVALDCSLSLGTGKGPWAKACTALQSALAADGALIAAPGAAADVRIELRAEGAVQERKDSEDSRAGWRFQGKLRATARGPAGLDLADEYEGLTGWNPVSAQMATDLLALNALKRLDNALNAFWNTK
jgi:hypothetical protein